MESAGTCVLWIAAWLATAATPAPPDPARLEANRRKAQELLEQAKHLDPRKPAKVSEALLLKCLALDPDHAECHMALGDLSTNPEKSRRHYEEFLRLAPDHPMAEKVWWRLQPFSNGGWRIIHMPKGDLVRPPDDQHLAEDPWLRAWELYDLAEQSVEKNQLDEAEARLLRCLQANPRLAEGHLLLGSVYAKKLEPSKGAEHYREFLRLAPEHHQAEKVRQILQGVRGEVPVSPRASDPKYQEALQFLQDGRDAMARKVPGKPLPADFARSSRSAQELAKLRSMEQLAPLSERLADARLAYEACVRVDPKMAACHYVLGYMDVTGGQRDRAMKHFREALALAPDDESARLARFSLERYDAWMAWKAAHAPAPH
ncbi:MAG TPA: hypothetical protein VIG99_23595 [Myxococcaceae bacterium]|jgi:tetratricopeptide (TPR) repeat protein